MTFREATDRAQALGMTGAHLAACFEVRPNTYWAMRIEEGPNARTPPPGWPETLARAISERVGELEGLRKELEGQG
jgi:hypothetical protein